MELATVNHKELENYVFFAVVLILFIIIHLIDLKFNFLSKIDLLHLLPMLALYESDIDEILNEHQQLLMNQHQAFLMNAPFRNRARG